MQSRMLAAMLAGSLCCFVLTGCSSTMVGHRLEDTPPAHEKGGAGIPYNLTKPAFKLTEATTATAGARPTYELAVEWVPDPEQRYSLAIDPNLFAKTEFKMLFGDEGNLTELNATTEEQLTGTITAIGTFAANVIGSIAGVGGTLQGLTDTAGQVFDQASRTILFQKMLGKLYGCAQVPQGDSAKCVTWEAWQKRFPDPGDEFFDQLYTLILAEKEHIEDAESVLKKIWSLAEIAEEAYEGKIPDLGSADEQKQAKAFLDNVRKAKSKDDLKELKDGDLPQGIRAEATRLMNELGRTLKEAVENLPPARRAEVQPLLDADTQTHVVVKAHAELKGLRAVSKLARKDVRYRHVLYLERALADRTFELLEQRRTEAQGEDPDLEALRLEYASTIDGMREELRAREIRAALGKFVANASQRKHPIGQTAPMKDYEIASAELKSLEDILREKRSNLEPVKSGDPPAAATAPAASSRDIYPAVLWRNADSAIDAAGVKACLDAPTSCESAWTSLPTPAAMPEFVIVVEKGIQP